MAELYRKRYNGVDAITLGSSLTNSATSITFNAALQSMGANIATLGTDEYLPLVIDNEIVYLTAYTAGATTGTISRGKEGTTGAAHSSGAAVVHGPTVLDFPGGGGPGLAILGGAYLRHATVDTALTPATGSFAEVDSTNLKATVTIPASGVVYVKAVAGGSQNASNTQYWAVWDQTAGAVIAGTSEIAFTSNPGITKADVWWKLTGLTPGVRTLSMAWKSTSGGAAALYHGPNYGTVVFEVWG